MECNKDEATRAKEIAERKFTAKDILGAKKFALKAQNLFPGLEGMPQMLATLDVYISAENKINGEADWYGILGVDPLADDETIRKHYRKLALTLHPDKNKSIGADGAFKFISKAWSLLSDKAKRSSYDQKRNIKAQKVSTKSGGTSAHTVANGDYNFTKTATSSAKVHKNTTKPHASTSTHKQKSSTFWTVCHRCKMQYEYLRVYLNLKLLCPNCHEAFLAVETAPPPANGVRPATSWNFSQQQHNFNSKAPSKNKLNAGKNNMNPNIGSGSYSNTDFQWAPFSRTSGVSTAAQAASVVQQAYEKVKREREEAQAATKREQALRRKQHSKRGYGNSAKRRKGMEESASQMGMRNGVVGAANPCGSKQGNFERDWVNGFSKTSSAGVSSQLELNNLLMEKARKEIDKKLKEVQSNTVAETAVRESGNEKGEESLRSSETLDQNTSGKSEDGNGGSHAIKTSTGTAAATTGMETVEMSIDVPDPDFHGFDKKLKEVQSNTVAKTAVRESGNEKGEESLRSSETLHQNTSGKSEDGNGGSHAIKTSTGTAAATTGMETLETSIDVPDPDFHDFDRDRIERSFGENQVWAAYDNEDGMPRYYAMIHSVISFSPFKLRISWLNSNTDSELAPLNWTLSGFSKTCGDFRRGRYEINKSLNSFSHKVRWRKGLHGTICIYPMKGDVWALYRNWSPDWDELTEYEVIHKYDMVEVLEDFSQEHGVIVTPLVKVAGFKTLFHRHLDPREIRVIPREEMSRFSHQVPSYLHTGIEAPNAPRGCRELDPAATPFELLQVIKAVEEEDIVGLENDFVEETACDRIKISKDEDMTSGTGQAREGEEKNSKNTQEIETSEEDKEKKISET